MTTAILGRKSDLEPITCAVCGRRAIGLGHCRKKGHEVAWSCGSPSCLAIGESVLIMSDKSLDVYEKTAIGEAGRAIVEMLGEAFMGALWQKGVRNLDDLTPEKFAAVAEAAHQTPEFNRAMVAFLTGFGASIRKQIARGDAPF